MKSRLFAAAFAVITLALAMPHAARAVDATAPYRIAQNDGTGTDGAAVSPRIPLALLRAHFPDAPPGAKVPSTLFGVHEDVYTQAEGDADLAVQLNRIRELNLGVLRFAFGWKRLFDVGPDCSLTKPIKARIRAMNEVLARLPERLEVVGILAQPPRSCIDLYKRDRAAFRQQYADYVARAVELFKHRVLAWDVWSEPNGSGFYLDPPGHDMWTAEEYFQDVFYPGASTIRRVDPTATIVLGSVALNGVVGHRCRANGTRRGHPCPPPRRTAYYVHRDFFPELFDYFNQHPEFKPYSLFDKIGLHPYYWTLFRPEGGRFRKFTYVPPSLMTYGPGGLVASIRVPRGKTFGVWWTELNEKLRLVIGNTQEEQARRFHDILEQALQDNRRRDFPLQLVDWFSLRDRGCPNRARSCFARDRDASGNRVRHRKWSGLIAYGTRGQPASHVPRKVFYTYKNFIADHTRIDYILDDFTSKTVNNEAYDRSFWAAGCTALNSCDSLFGGPATGDVLEMHAPASTHGPWTKVGLTSRHHIEIGDKNRVEAAFDFMLPASAAGDEHFAVVSLGNKGNAPDALGEFMLLFKRPAGGALSVQLVTQTNGSDPRPLMAWTQVAKRCGAPVMKGLDHAQLVVDASGAWDLHVQDSTGATCLAASDRSTGTKHQMSFGRQASMAIALMGLSEKGGGDFSYDNVRLEGLRAGEK